MTYTWLVSSGGRRGALVRILQDIGSSSRVVVSDASKLSAAGRLANEFVTVPRIDSPRFVPAMLDLCSEYAVDMLVPTIDTELMRYAECRVQFENIGTTVLISSPEVVRLAADKWQLYQWLQNHGFPTVNTVESRQAHTLTGPVVAKPRGGSASLGIVRADSWQELRVEELGAEYIIQSEAKGVEITTDFAVSKSGSFLGAVPRRRLEVRAGEVSKGVTVVIPRVQELVRDIAASMDGAFGILNLQTFYDRETDSVSVIELNARVGGGYPLSHAAGADFFTALVDQSDAPISHWQDGLVMLRFDDAVFFSSDEFKD